MGDFLYRVKHHFTFTRQEQKEFLITALATAFVLGFRKWGTTTFNVGEGLANLVLLFVLVAAALFVHIAAQKLLALKLGYVATYNYWLNGIFVGLIMAFVSYGFIPVILIGTVTLEHQAKLRLGRFRYGLNYKDVGKIAFAGVFANILFIAVLKPITAFSASPALQELALSLVWVNVLLATYSLLPFKNLDGLSVFFASRNSYVFALAFVVVYSLLVLATGVFSLVVAALLAIFITLVFLTIIDKP